MFRRNFLLIISGFLICIIAEFFIYQLGHRFNLFKPIFYSKLDYGSLETHEGGGYFTNPLLECKGVEGDESSTQLSVSVSELQDFIDTSKIKYKLDTISVYLRDLNNGPWIGINQNDGFIGGSLLKVPMLISYLKLSESNPDILKKVISYNKEEVSNVQYFTPSKQIQVGEKYTVEELLEYMIIYSDNNAASLLFENIDRKEFDKVFLALGLGDPEPDAPYRVDTKNYSGFFRILFNASYLSKDNSEKALGMLSKIEFNKGIQGELPKNIVVSHKFGIRSDGDLNQLHDCGIIYYPGHPYMLCVMSRGGTFDNMLKSISDISKFVYGKVSQVSKYEN